MAEASRSSASIRAVREPQAGTTRGIDFSTKGNHLVDTEPKLDARTAQWLETQRKIHPAIAALHGVVTVKGYPTFEYRDSSGELLYRKLRIHSKDGSKTYRRDRKGVPAALFNLPSLSDPLPNDDTPLIIGEGELECLSWLTAGATHVTSVPDGAQRDTVGEGDIEPLKDTTYQWLWGDDGKLLPQLRKFKRIILATDDDQPGRVLREELAVRLGVGRCWKLGIFGDGCKDANDVLRERGADALMDLLASAEPMMPTDIIALPDVPVVQNRYSWPVGWSNLCDNLILTSPELMTITGEPGAGKSQFAFILMLEMARLYQLNGFVLQFEDHPSRMQKDAIAYAKAWNGRSNASPHCGEDPEAWVRQRIYTMPPPPIGDEEPEMTLEWVKRQIEAAVLQKGCKIVILDPWNECEHMWGNNETETQYTNRALRELKGWARRLSICLIIVAHPNKSVQSKEIRDVSLYDISGSAAWNNKSDHGVILKRVTLDDEANTMTDLVDIKISKCKDWSTMGRPGQAVLRFDEIRRIYVLP